MIKRLAPIFFLLFSYAAKGQILLENYQFQPVQEFLKKGKSDSLFKLLNWDDKLDVRKLKIITDLEAYAKYDDSTYVILQLSDSILGNKEIPLCQNFIGDGGQAYFSAYLVKFNHNKYKLLVIEHFTAYHFGEDDDFIMLDTTDFNWLEVKDGELVTETFWTIKE